MSDATIKLNPQKSAEIEFEVSVQGTDDAEPIVRIVMDGCNDYKCVFECSHVENNKWMVKLPPLKHFTRTTVPFTVEVIVDGYFFAPAEGVAQLIEEPQVMFQKPTSKPSVTTSFTVKQGEEKKTEEDEQLGNPIITKQLVSPSAGGELSPTNALLRTEFDPAREQGNAKANDASARDEQIDKTRLSDIASHVTPGESTDPEPQEGLVPEPEDEGDEEDFDPKRVAESIVQSTVGRISPPTKKGNLFERDQKTGKPIVRGIETPEQKVAKATKAQRVKEILNNK